MKANEREIFSKDSLFYKNQMMDLSHNTLGIRIAFSDIVQVCKKDVSSQNLFEFSQIYMQTMGGGTKGLC